MRDGTQQVMMSHDEGTNITVDQVLWEHRASDGPGSEGVCACACACTSICMHTYTQKTDNITGTIIL